jgi:hypothetical protein
MSDAATVEAVRKLDGNAGREAPVTLERPGASPLRQPSGHTTMVHGRWSRSAYRSTRRARCP